MSAAAKLTEPQRFALTTLAGCPRGLSTGPASNGLRGMSGSALSALARRGLVSVEYNALFETTYYDITDAGRAALGQR